MSLRLDKAVGPECPQCGCTETAMIDSGRRAHYCWAKFECDHCGRRFGIGNKTDVPKQKAQCPYCGSANTLATSTPGQVQKRKCCDCQRPFKDVR